MKGPKERQMGLQLEAESPGYPSPLTKVSPSKFKVPRLSVHTAKEALGVHSLMLENVRDQVKYLCKKTEKWRDAVQPKWVNAYDAWYCLNSTIMKTIQYRLVHIFDKQLHHV
jgi:hypothetical protein